MLPLAAGLATIPSQKGFTEGVFVIHKLSPLQWEPDALKLKLRIGKEMTQEVPEVFFRRGGPTKGPAPLTSGDNTTQISATANARSAFI